MVDSRACPRFPWLPALLCAGSLAMAAWTWARYSYVWRATPEEIVFEGWEDEDGMRFPPGSLVRFEARASHAVRGVRKGTMLVSAYSTGADPREIRAIAPASGDLCTAQGNVVIEGRVSYRGGPSGDRGWVTVTTVDATAGRLHPASVSGLVVAAMGTFVFSLYLRLWIRERKPRSDSDQA